MTQEEKSLLLKDLCARLPYEVIVDYAYNTFKNGLKEGKLTILTCNILSTFISPRMNETNEYIKPYLRPLSSMTEEEKIDYQAFFNYDGVEYPEEYIDWLNKHHFDYRGLIEKGLAIEAPDDMYKIK